MRTILASIALVFALPLAAQRPAQAPAQPPTESAPPPFVETIEVREVELRVDLSSLPTFESIGRKGQQDFLVVEAGMVGGGVLVVSQFTLYASVKKGNRPSWSRAARGDKSRPLFDSFVARLASELGKPVATGVFGADMQVNLINDGPVTVFVDSKSPE